MTKTTRGESLCFSGELDLRAYFVTVVCMLAASLVFALNNYWHFAFGLP